MKRVKTNASVSLDADNLWAYQMTHGDPGWDSYPTYLDDLVDAVLPGLAERNLTITFFVVGQDAELEVNHAAVRSISEHGHEIGNHSFRHQPWMHQYSIGEIHTELSRAEKAIEDLTGQRPVGFRGPGYSLSPDVLRVLSDRGYLYDCSTLPTVIGPIARWYYFRSAKLTPGQRSERANLFGGAKDGLRRLKPYYFDLGDDRILEIPVTTMPFVRIPIHVSYVLYLAGISPALAFDYFKMSMRLCALRGVEPSLLLHPLDFLGSDDVDSLRFFPGMSMTGLAKREIVWRCLDELSTRFNIIPMKKHAKELLASANLPVVSAASTAVSAGK